MVQTTKTKKKRYKRKETKKSQENENEMIPTKANFTHMCVFVN